MQAKKVWEKTRTGNTGTRVLWALDEDFPVVDEEGLWFPVQHLVTKTGSFRGSIETTVESSDEGGNSIVYGDPIRVFRGVKDHAYAMGQMGFEIASEPTTPPALPRTDVEADPEARGN